MTGISRVSSISSTNSNEALSESRAEQKDKSSFSQNIKRLCGCVPGAFQALISGLRNSRSREVAVPTKIQGDHQGSRGEINELIDKIDKHSDTVTSKLESCSDIETLRSLLKENSSYERETRIIGFKLEHQEPLTEFQKRQVDKLQEWSGYLGELGLELGNRLESLNEDPPTLDQIRASGPEKVRDGTSLDAAATESQNETEEEVKSIRNMTDDELEKYAMNEKLKWHRKEGEEEKEFDIVSKPGFGLQELDVNTHEVISEWPKKQ
ncbi:hypothetical protein [Microbulbifer sp. TRSA007]|uniref:hypothetical protein n=1 Tax=Microbulbifer sp. TRSA007 TaxID=3243384 RepID=UPI0040397DC8